MSSPYADLEVWRAAALDTQQYRRKAKGLSPIVSSKHFVSHARGSVFEIETQLRLALRLGYISEEETGRVLRHVARVGQMIGGVIRSVRPAA